MYPGDESREGEDDRSLESISVRKKFLLHMYDQLWQSIQRVDGGIWSFVAAYAAIAVSFSAGFQGTISIFFASIFSIIIAFWGMNLSIVSSRWFNRNLIQITNIEEAFLENEDFGRIFPEDYNDPGNRFFDFSSINFYVLNFASFSSALVAITISVFVTHGSLLSAIDQSILLLSLLLGSGITYHNYCASWNHVEKMYQKTKQDAGDSNIGTKGKFSNLLSLLLAITVLIFLLSTSGEHVMSIFFGSESLTELIFCFFITLVLVSIVLYTILPFSNFQVK